MFQTAFYQLPQLFLNKSLVVKISGSIICRTMSKLINKSALRIASSVLLLLIKGYGAKVNISFSASGPHNSTQR